MPARASGAGLLALNDGTLYEGLLFGAKSKGSGEIVFNTSMTGYPEVLTDPSYTGQMVAMTYPEIGNYGIHPSQAESSRAHVAGFIVRSLCEKPSSWLNRGELSGYLAGQGIPGISGVDTRELTIRIRDHGVPRGVIVQARLGKAKALALARAVPDISERDCVGEVSCAKSYIWREGARSADYGPRTAQYGFRVAAVDCGIKYNILRDLAGLGCRVTVLPATFRAEQVLEGGYDGLFLSNGPGDPATLPDIVDQVRRCMGRIPIFGICLGHQILGRALGCRTFKLKFGHHGGNHPVKNLSTGRVEITVQNHNYCVNGDDLRAAGAEVSHLNLNDGTVEGMRHPGLKAFSVQYHPEGAPGPHDSKYLFGDFMKLMKNA